MVVEIDVEEPLSEAHLAIVIPNQLRDPGLGNFCQDSAGLLSICLSVSLSPRIAVQYMIVQNK